MLQFQDLPFIFLENGVDPLKEIYPMYPFWPIPILIDPKEFVDHDLTLDLSEDPFDLEWEAYVDTDEEVLTLV